MSEERETSPTVEAFAVLDTFVTGPGRVDMLGTNNMRVTLVAQSSDEYGQQRMVVSKLVGARADMLQIA